MKTAIYIEDGIVQLVITPESEFEKNALSTMQGHPLDVQIFSGSFYDCRGGWVKQSGYYNSYVHSESHDNNDQSIILKISEPQEALK